jgi:hypothetical protein
LVEFSRIIRSRAGPGLARAGYWRVLNLAAQVAGVRAAYGSICELATMPGPVSPAMLPSVGLRSGHADRTIPDLDLLDPLGFGPGLLKVPFSEGVMHYDPPPQLTLTDLEGMRRRGEFRFANMHSGSPAGCGDVHISPGCHRMIGRGYRPGGQLGRDLLHRRAKLRLDTGCSSSRSTNRAAHQSA